jgi:hypothetical protein
MPKSLGWKDVVLVAGAAVVQVIVLRWDVRLGVLGVALVLWECTRVVLRRVDCTVNEAHLLGTLSERRRSGSRRLTSVKDDVPTGRGGGIR